MLREYFSTARGAFFARLLCRAALALACAAAPAAQGAGTSHPLDPLTRDEINAAAQVLKDAGKVTDKSRFSTVVLSEPPKAEVLAFRPGGEARREAFAVVYEREANKTFEAVVDVKGKRLVSWKEIPGAQPPMLIEDVLIMQSVLRGDPQWQAAMRRRGITDLQDVVAEPWSAGGFGFREEAGVRVFKGVSFLRGKGVRNHYARPIEGVIAVVDLNRKRVIKLIDSGVVPVPQATAELGQGAAGPLRLAPKPLVVAQPDGPGFEVNGHEVRWQNWRFRYALHPREGLVLYTVGYEDQGRLRPILYRAALSEMVVPYGDPGEAWFFRNAFDVGEYGVGRSALQLEPGTDLPANAQTFGVVFAGETGGGFEARDRVAFYERDGGVLWKHADYLTNHNESRRARELVLSYFANVGNYEYGFNWVFHQDGALEMEVLLTGIMAAKGVRPENGGEHSHSADLYSHPVAEGVAAVHHQHTFNFRLDFDLDGAGANSVVEQNIVALPPGPKNPYHNAFTMTETVLKTELEARRQLSLQSGRKWRVVNPAVRNALGQPVGYTLIPGENAVPYAGPKSSVAARAGFMSAHLWVTPYDASEMYAAGNYVNQSAGGEGLPKWVRANRRVENRDVVVWYTMGVNHIPRPEDWPVMPVHRASFKLVPTGFFARNPALDVPKP
jgi:primary-amine oxidase